MSDKVVRIGGASAFINDSSTAAPQLIAGGVDYLVFDYLAEVTMTFLARARRANPNAGFAADFVDVAMRENLAEILRRRIKVVANAGGQNPQSCARALEALCRELGLSPRIAVVEGDDLADRAGEFASRGVVEMYSGAPWPGQVLSINAYLGAFPIAAALASGADIVITGRVVDSALTLGPLIFEFAWTAHDLDRLAQGSLAGHIIECGAQATGGLFTDWREVPDWANIGYPIIECFADGRFIVTKPEGTGGLVSPATVGEQLLYEVGDPSAYLLPDVACDFRHVRLRQPASNRVEVTGARGRAPSGRYKACLTYQDGWRAIAVMPVIGIDAAAKAQRQAEAILERTRAMLRARNLGDYRRTLIENLGAEAGYGAHARAGATREVVCKIGVEHEERAGVELFIREYASPTTSMSPGSTGWFAGVPQPSPVVGVYSFLIDRREAPARITVNGAMSVLEADGPVGDPSGLSCEAGPTALLGEDTVTVPLIRLAYARSGDKGDTANIGVIARRPDYLPYLRANLTAEAVAAHMAHLFDQDAAPRVERFELPGFDALNFLLHAALGGGGAGSLRADPLAKGLAQQLLDMPVRVPASLA